MQSDSQSQSQPPLAISPASRREFLQVAGLALSESILNLEAQAGPTDTPSVYWVSHPAQPDESVMVVGGDLGSVTAVKTACLPDKPFGVPLDSCRWESVASVLRWHECAPLQVSDVCVKFVIPMGIGQGMYLCRLISKSATSPYFIINAPETWWLQGDRGDTTTHGGWLRLFGRSLADIPKRASGTIHAENVDYPRNAYPIPERNGYPSASRVCLTGKDGKMHILRTLADDIWSLRCSLDNGLPPGEYRVHVHNGHGGRDGWTFAGLLVIHPLQNNPHQVFNVMDFYGANAAKEILRTLRKGSPSVDRTDAVLAALKKSEVSGGGVVYFPRGVYTLRAPLQVPPHTILRGEGMGLTTIWWGTGNMALDGGSDQRRLTASDSIVPPVMIFGDRYAMEDLTLILPRKYRIGIQTGDGFRMNRVRTRVDRYWIRSGERENGLLLQLGNDCQITDSDILARGVALSSGEGIVVARNRIVAGKSNADLSHSDGVIVEDNVMISMDPTAYINLSGEGRNLYYARNRHEAFYSQQSDFSWTFDGVAQAYLGRFASVHGVDIELGEYPKYPDWAKEDSALWRRSVVCVLGGKGEGQYRYVVENRGRSWKVDRPFSIPPDSSSLISIIPYRGNVMLIGNRFEDAGWVNLGYGSSFNVIGANNQTFRVGEMLNMGLRNTDGVMPSWYVQYHDNDIRDGDTMVQSVGDMRNSQLFSGSVTRFCLHRGQHIHEDNWGGIGIVGNAEDVIVEGCILDNPNGEIRVDEATRGVLLRNNNRKSS